MLNTVKMVENDYQFIMIVRCSSIIHQLGKLSLLGRILVKLIPHGKVERGRLCLGRLDMDLIHPDGSPEFELHCRVISNLVLYENHRSHNSILHLAREMR